jgi:segregation and condensation protein B
MNSLPPAEQIRIEATPLAPPLPVAGDIARLTIADPMTLRRFVAVTYANFRSLLFNWSQSSLVAMSTPAMPPSTPAPTRSLASAMNSPGAEAAAQAHAIPAAAAQVDTGHTASPFAAGGAHGSLLPEEGVGAGRLTDDDFGDDDLPMQPELGLAVAEITVSGLSLTGALESLLFVADGPAEVATLAKALQLHGDTVRAGLVQLASLYRDADRGLRLQVTDQKYQLVSAPAAGPLIERFLNVEAGAKLSPPALETLALVAYRQPITRAQIEAVRGVDCSAVLRSLQQRGLIEETARLDAPGRPVLYGVTDQFLHHFGLTALEELPPLEIPDASLLDNTLGNGLS